MAGQGQWPAGQARLLRPRLSFGVARWRAPEQDGGVEGRPLGARAAQCLREILFRPRVLEERAVPYLDGVPVLAGKTAQEAIEAPRSRDV